MSSLPSYLSSGASSRAHHAFLVKLHRAQSDQEEDEVIRQEVQRCKRELGVKGGASLSTVVDTLTILLHCTVYQNRPGIFSSESQEGPIGSSGPSRVSASRQERGEEDWALMAALQVVEQAKTIREKRIGYLFLSERMPRDHELRLMLINTIRKDLESKDIAHVLLALAMIIKQPSADLAPAVTPILTSKTLLKHAKPAVRQRALQSLVALHLPAQPALAAEGSFPLSMSKVVRLLAAEQDLGVLCVLLRLLERLLDSGAHQCQSTTERVYLVQQMTGILNRLQPDSQAAIAAVRALKSVFGAEVAAVEVEGDDELLRAAVGEVDGVLGRMTSDVDDSSALSGALVLEICSLFDIATYPDLALPTTLQHCLKFISGILCPPSSSSQPTLPPANDHILVLRCLSQIPLARWDKELGADEMGTIMRGLESADDSVRKATLSLLRTSAPQVLEQTFDSYLTSLRQASDLALPMQLPPDLDDARKMQLALQETAGRALEVVFISEGGKEAGTQAADSVYAVLDAMQGGQGSMSEDEVVWVEGMRTIEEFLERQSMAYQSSFAGALMVLPSIPSPDLVALRARCVCKYFGDGQQPGVSAALMEDLAAAEGSDLQDQILAAMVWAVSQTGGNHDEALGKAHERLSGLMRDKKLSKRIRTRIDMVLNLMSAGALTHVRAKISLQSPSPADVQDAIESVWNQHQAAVNQERLSSSAHTIQPGKLAASPRDGSASTLRYGPYEPPVVKAKTGTSRF